MSDNPDVLTLDLAALLAADPSTPPASEAAAHPSDLVAADVCADTPETLILNARRRIELRCGRSSLVLYPDGRIVLRGEYILSDAESVNRIAGGQIELN